MPTHTHTSHGFSQTLTSLKVPAPQNPISQRALPRLSDPATNTLKALELDKSALHTTFKQWILGYGVSFVAHALIFERASEVVRGLRTRESFVESITGEKNPKSEHDWRAFPASQLQAAVFIPPCWNKGAANNYRKPDPTITLLDDDLANCFLNPSKRQHGGALRSFITRAQDLDSLLTPKLLRQGLQFIETGWARAVSEYVKVRQDPESGFILGANHLMDYYQEVIESCTSRTRAQLPNKPAK
jgi:hypothetical protein